MKKLILVLAASCLAFLTACDPNYQIDDNHPVNYDDIRLFENGLDFPVGSTAPIHLSDVIKVEDESSALIRIGSDGNLSLHFGSSEPITRSVSVPSLMLNAIEAETGLLTTYDFPAEEVGKYDPSFTETMSLDADYPYSWETDTPSGIVSLSSVALESNVTFILSAPQGAYTIKSGGTVTFPATMTLTTADSRLSIADGHTLTLTEDVHIGYGSNTSFVLTLRRLETEGYFDVAKKKISINETVHVKGSIMVSGSDFSSNPASFGIFADVNTSKMTVNELVGHFDVKATTNSVSYNLEDVPESLLSSKIILSDPSVYVKVFNGSPFRFKVNTSVSAEVNAATTYKKDIVDFSIEPYKDNIYSLPKEDVRNFTQQIPLRFVMGGTTASCDPEAEVTIVASDTYTYSVEYGFDAPLAFENGTDISYHTTLTDLGINLGTQLNDSDVSFAFDLINTLPFDLDVDFVVVEPDGKPEDGVMITSPSTIPAGNVGTPSTSAIKLEMSFTNLFDGTIDNILMAFHGKVPAEYSGVVWNKDQYVKIENASIHVGPISNN